MTDGVILLVDDDVAIVSLIRRFLEKDGFLVCTAGNGKEALKILESEKVKLLVTDYRMPGMDGIELIRYARGNYPNVNVVLCTADITLDAEQLRQLGLDFQVLQKPFIFHHIRILAYESIKNKTLANNDQNVANSLIL